MMHSGRTLVAAGLVAALLGGGIAHADGVSADAPSSGDIVNGIPTHLQPATGALLFVGPDKKNEFLDCSAVLIGCRTVLTAAHCLCKRSLNSATCTARELRDLDVADLRVFFQHSGIHNVRDVVIHPDYVRGKRNDLAVLTLAQRVHGVEPAQINSTRSRRIGAGRSGVIAGFGNRTETRLDAAIKRVGTVRTASCPSGIPSPDNLCWNHIAPVDRPGTDSNSCFKDDGGPLFLDFGRGPVVAGILSETPTTCAADTVGFSTNVFPSAEWIKAAGGADVGRDQCSDLGEVGEAWVEVQGGEGNMPRHEDERRFAFFVPQDAELLRVTANGDTERGADYDLFVKFDSAPTKFNAECEVRGVGQFGACEFDIKHRKVKVVHVLIRHVKQNQAIGRSRFQVTATAFLPAPPPGDAPRRPEQLRAQTKGPGFERLFWRDASDDETGFELQRKEGKGDEGDFSLRKINKANKTSFLDNVDPATIYTYRVRSFNLHGSSDWSNVCTVNDPGPTSPRRLRADDIRPRRISLVWEDRSADESGFEVQRRRPGEKKWNTLANVGRDTTTYLDSAVAPSTTYEYRVRARGRTAECIPHSKFAPKQVVTSLSGN
jgi:hypothetical protein